MAHDNLPTFTTSGNVRVRISEVTPLDPPKTIVDEMQSLNDRLDNALANAIEAYAAQLLANQLTSGDK